MRRLELAWIAFTIILNVALLVLLLAGCWGAYTSPEQPSRPPAGHVRDFACVTLEAGRVPREPLISESCNHDPIDDDWVNSGYWVCRSHMYERWADELSSWAMSAIAECAP